MKKAEIIWDNGDSGNLIHIEEDCGFMQCVRDGTIFETVQEFENVIMNMSKARVIHIEEEEEQKDEQVIDGKISEN